MCSLLHMFHPRCQFFSIETVIIDPCCRHCDDKVQHRRRSDDKFCIFLNHVPALDVFIIAIVAHVDGAALCPAAPVVQQSTIAEDGHVIFHTHRKLNPTFPQPRETTYSSSACLSYPLLCLPTRYTTRCRPAKMRWELGSREPGRRKIQIAPHPPEGEFVLVWNQVPT